MKLTDMVINYIMKGGIISESRNLDIEIDIPDSNVTVRIKCENLTVRTERNSKEET